MRSSFYNSGFLLRRLIAFLVDYLLLAIPATYFAATYFDALVSIGQTGKLFGFVPAMLYFGVCNSRITNGRTLGKLLAGLRVVGQDGLPLSAWRALVRATVQMSPLFFVTVDLRPLFPHEPTPTYALQIWCLLTVGLGTVTFMQWIVGARELAHDLIAESYVVRVREADLEPVRPSIRKLASVVAALVIAWGIPLVPLNWLDTTDLGRAIALPFKFRSALERDRSLKFSGFSAETPCGPQSASCLSIDVDVAPPKGEADFEPLLRRFAATLLQLEPHLLDQNTLVVSAAYGSDLGIAGCYTVASKAGTIAEWRRWLSSQAPLEMALEKNLCNGPFFTLNAQSSR